MLILNSEGREKVLLASSLQRRFLLRATIMFDFGVRLAKVLKVALSHWNIINP